MVRSIFLISWQQFGYHTDMFNYCKYLKQKSNITFISFDHSLPRIQEEGINIIYVPIHKSKIINRIVLYLYIFYYIIKINPDITIIKYFRGCSVIKSIMINRKIILDIRTATVCIDKKERVKKDYQITKESRKFKYITVINENIAKRLNIEVDSYKVLPLGGKTMISIDKKQDIFSEGLSLIYVGTLDGRRIQDTIIAFNKLSEKYGGKNLNYIIIGFSNDKDEENKIKSLINQNKYNNIKFLGRIPNEDLGYYFENSNVGISYIPKTEYFNFQPPTKTYEYLFNGLYTFATDTEENKKIIKDYKNGKLIDDNPESLYIALDELYKSYKDIKLTRKDIIESVKNNSWENICDKLYVDLENIISKSKKV